MAEYLDYTGLTYFKNKLDQQNNNKYVAKGIKINGVALNSSDITINAVDSTARIPASEKGIANGVATLDSTGKVPASQLPSYVDDVKEYENLANFPSTGETDKLYLAIDTGNIYRWSGSQYVQINNSVSTAESAVKDGDGNTITTTYATKTENAAKLDANSANYIKSLSISDKTITYTKGNNTTGTLTTQDTTYGAGTAALLTAGTDTANRVWTAKILHDALPVTMTAATASAAGKGGLVPAPAAGKQASFLRGDGTWVVPTDTKYSAMTETELNTGTATTARTITAKVLSDFVEGATSSITTEQIDALFV